jgi:hypothetical protein
MAETTWFDGNYSTAEGEALALIEALRAMRYRNMQ